MLTLSSDFGWPYPAAMRGVMLQETDARLVDISHEFPRQDVRTAAFWLREIVPWFPPAVHCVVVDPGVGTDRDALVVEAGDHILVGPDNGVLCPVARAVAGDAEIASYAIEYDAASTTFHGRDVFAPMAARIHERGIETMRASGVLQPVSAAVDLEFPEPSRTDGSVQGTVLVVDGFGNVVTNIPGDTLEVIDDEHLTVNGVRTPLEATYAAVDPGTALVTVGSHGNVELAVNRGRGDDAFDLAAGDDVTLRWDSH